MTHKKVYTRTRKLPSDIRYLQSLVNKNNKTGNKCHTKTTRTLGEIQVCEKVPGDFDPFQ